MTHRKPPEWLTVRDLIGRQPIDLDLAERNRVEWCAGRHSTSNTVPRSGKAGLTRYGAAVDLWWAVACREFPAPVGSRWRRSEVLAWLATKNPRKKAPKARERRRGR